MLIFRRFCVVQIFMLWQGGFLFYTSFVVPTGTQVLGSATTQGAITARVTDWLNVVGVVGLAVAALEMNYTNDTNDRRTTVRWSCWSIALVCQWWLFFLHQLLTSFMNPERTQVLVQPLFYPVHRMYLWTSTIQWFACILLVWFLVAAWRSEDGQKP